MGKSEHFNPWGICDTCLTKTLVTSPFLFEYILCDIYTLLYFFTTLLVGVARPFFKNIIFAQIIKAYV